MSVLIGKVKGQAVLLPSYLNVFLAVGVNNFKPFLAVFSMKTGILTFIMNKKLSNIFFIFIFYAGFLLVRF